MAEKNFFERLMAAMDSQYIQEHPDEVIELLVEGRAELEKAANDMRSLIAQLNVARDMTTMVRIATIKEFAERLKAKSKQGKGYLGNVYHSVDVNEIDNLLEGMVGEFYVK